MHTVLSSASRQVVIGDDQPFCIIGERRFVNPTGGGGITFSHSYEKETSPGWRSTSPSR